MAFDDGFGSTPFDPSAALDSLIRRQADDIPDNSPVDADQLVDRLARKVGQPARRQRIEPPEAATPPAAPKPAKSDAPDFSSFGTPADQLPDFSSFGTPADQVPLPQPRPAGAPAPVALPSLTDYPVEFGKGVAEGAKNMGAASLKGVAGIHIPAAIPTSDDLLGGLAQAPAMQPGDRARLMSRALKEIGDRGLQMDYNSALRRVSQGGDPNAEIAALRPKFEAINKAAQSPVTEQPLYQAGQAVENYGKEALAPRPGFEPGKSWTRDIGSGAGSVIAGIGVSMVPGIGPAAAGALFTTAGSGEAVDNAVKGGATPQQTREAARWGGLAGATDMVDTLLPMLGTTGKVVGFVKRVGIAAVKGALMEGGQEGVQQLMQNAIAKGIYKPDQDMSEDVARSVAIAAILGGMGGGISGAAHKPDHIEIRTEHDTTQPGAAPGIGGPQGPSGSGPTGGPRSSPEDIADFVRKANEGAPAQPQAAPSVDPSTMSNAEKVDAFNAARDAHGGASETDILKAQGLSDAEIKGMSSEERLDAIIRGQKPGAQDTRTDEEKIRDTEAASGVNVKGAAESRREAPKPSAGDEEYSILRAGGYTDENIADMSPAQRKSEASYYKDELGIDVAAAMKNNPRPAQSAPRGQTTGAGTREEPIKANSADDVLRASEQVANPTDAQAKAENYRHGHLEIDHLGLRGTNSISVETGVGGIRKGTDASGKAWEVRMPVAYGRIKGTKGADGQPLDIFIGPTPSASHVFVIDQHHGAGGGFDEHKIMTGFANPRSALDAYQESYSDRGGDRIAGVTVMTPEVFKNWIKNGDTTKPLKKEPPSSAHGLGEAGPSLVREAGTDRGATVSGPAEATIPKSDERSVKHPTDTGKNIPESRATLKAQQNQLIAGERAVQMFPAGTKVMPLPPGMNSVSNSRGTFHFNPKLIGAGQITEASNSGRENELLGLGSVPKAEVMKREAAGEKPVAVVERTADGTEVRAAAGTETTAEQQRAELDKGKSPGNTVAIEPTQDVLDKRHEEEPAEVTAEHVDQIETVLGEDADRVAPVDIQRAAEIMADNDGMDPATAFGQAVIENAVKGGFLTEQEAKDAYGEEVENILEPGREGASGSSRDVEQEGAEPVEGSAGGGAETGVAARGGEGGGKGQAGAEAGDREQHDTGRAKPNAKRKARGAAVEEGAEPAENADNALVGLGPVEKAKAIDTEATGRYPDDDMEALAFANGAKQLDWNMAMPIHIEESAVIDAFNAGRKWAGITGPTYGEQAEVRHAEARAKQEAAANKPLAEKFADRLADTGFQNILAARKLAKENGVTDIKAVEEALEYGAVIEARRIVEDDTDEPTPRQKFDALVELYGRQPKLGTRTSTSVRDQAYSTPVPLAYVASRLAEITADTTVYEPTAGNGALLIEANPKNAYVNEINSQRRQNLLDQGFTKTTGGDASEVIQGVRVDALKKPGAGVDVVISNPPFGTVKEAGGESKRFYLSDIRRGYDTTEIDHAIALRALEAMKDNGRSVLILGGINKLVSTTEGRSDAYNGKAKRLFYKALYDAYNVTDHFTVAGELYERQGAGWPVDVIVIEGRGKSARPLPAVDVPRIYKTWAELGGLLDERTNAGNARPAGKPDETAAGAATELADNGGRDRDRAGSEQSGLEKPGNVRGEPAADADTVGGTGGEGGAQPRRRQRSARPRPEPAAERPSHGLEDFDAQFDAALDDAYGEKPNDDRGQPIIGAGVVVRTVSGRETSPAPKVATDTNRGTGNSIKRLNNWLLDEARKEVTGDSYQTTLLKGLNGDKMSPADVDHVNQVLFGDADGPRPSDIVRTERTGKQTAKSAVKNATESADAAFSGLYELFGGPKASSGFTFDEDTYKKAKPMFEKAAEKFAAFKNDTAELIRRMVAHMRDALAWPREVMERMRPYLKRFMEEQRSAPEDAPRQPKEKKAQSAVETEGQVRYTPKSKSADLDTLVPVNMRRSIEDSLDALESRVGQIDDFVAHELGYERDVLDEYFGAEQIDALGLAIDNIKRGKGFIIGDQTGIGKGRVNAAIIRWAIKNDRIPIFVTEKPGLYADMYRDMRDIGMFNGGFLDGEPRILATNTGLKLPLDEAGPAKISNGDAKAHSKLMLEKASPNAGDFFKTHDMVFTNYSQMQTVKGEDTARRQFLQSIAPASVVIFDESHNAGGQVKSRKPKGPADRSDFARDVIRKANGVFYSSATYAKRPDVMSLYSATNMSMAVDNLDDLAEAIERGGVPMQQVVATMLADDGQYIRRERSFDGINYNTPAIEVDHAVYNDISRTLSAIQDFSGVVKKAAAEISKQLKAEGAAMDADGSTGEAGASSTNFTAVMHNVINQMLLAMKAAPAAQHAIAAIERGEKPVITVANTMESFMTDYADALGIGPGDVIPADFSDVLQKYLDRTRTIIIKKPFAKKGETIRHYLTDKELGQIGRMAYNQAKKIIDDMDLSSLAVSPIDQLKNLMDAKGYRVGEITGRSLIVDYSGDKPVLRTRPSGETSTRGRNATRARFNKKPENGGLHAIVINQAGSTGISMHSSRTFDDQSKRRMIIAQAEGNIDTHMQLLGRVNRTGQVALPEYDQLVADIPAEKRPAAVLAKKMASLNANTTASRTSAVTAKDVPDFVNEYGDMVAISFLADNLELNPKLAFPVKMSEAGTFTKADAMRKLTGRIPLLLLKQQEEVYQHLEDEYDALIKQLEAGGGNALEAKTLDLKAKPIETYEVQGQRNSSGSRFAEPVNVEKVSVARLGKPMLPAEVLTRLSEAVGDFAANDRDTQTFANLDDEANQGKLLAALNDPYSQMGKRVTALEKGERTGRVKAFEDYTRPIIDEIADPAAQKKEMDKFNAIKDRWSEIHQLVPIGRRVTLKTADGNLTGIVLSVGQKGHPKNPLAMSSWKATFAIADATRQITLPFSRMFKDGASDSENMLDVEVAPLVDWIETASQTLDRFRFGQTEAREERFIATGNLLAAYDWLNNRGAIINYTDHRGAIRQGILTARGFDVAEQALLKGRIVNDPAEIVAYLKENPYGNVQTEDQVVRIEKARGYNDRYAIITEKKKSTGGTYYLDEGLLKHALYGNFVGGRGKEMVGEVTPDNLPAAVKRMQELGAQFKLSAATPKGTAVPDDGLAAVQAGMFTPAAADKMPQIQDLVRAGVRKLLGDHVNVEFSEDLIPVGAAQTDRYGGGAARNAGAYGMYHPFQALIRLALRKQTLMRGLFHESYHAIEYQLQTPQERELMQRETANLRNYLKRKGSKHNVDALDGEEVRAIAFETYAMDRQAKGEERAGEGIHIGIRRWFSRLYEMLRQLGNGLRGLGFQTWEDIFNKAYEGGYREASGDTPRPEADHGLAAMAPGGPESYDTRLPDVIRTRALGNWNLTEARVQLQDKFIRIKNAEASVGGVNTSQSAYQAESLYYGRTGQRLQQLEETQIDPLVRDIKGRDLTTDEVNEFLIARHAQERNERVGALHEPGTPFFEAINDTSIVGASGMSTDEANTILDRIDASGKRADYDAIEVRIRDIIDRTRQTLLNTGLISQETADAWASDYANYVPLRGFAEGSEHEESSMGVGRGFDTRAKESKKALGRGSMADGPLQYILLQAEMAIVRGEKNRVGNTFLRFVQDNADPQRWTVNKPQIVRTIDKSTGLVTSMPDNFADYRDDNVFITKVGGKPYRIRLVGPDGANIARALKNMGTVNMHGIFRFFNVLTRTMARLSTQWNPEFTLSNFIRDAGEAFVNLQGEQQRGITRQFSKHLLPSIKGAMQALAGTNPTDRYVQAFHEMDKAGGRIRFFGLEDVDDIKRSVAAKMRRLEGGTVNNIRDFGDKLAKGLEIANGGIENATRLAAYMAARDVGLSQAQAATIARELTVNFNRSGELGPAINSLYMFANASTQGAVRSAQAMQHPRVRKAIYALASAAALAALYSIGAGGDDDNGESYYAKIPSWERDKNIILMWPKGMGHDGQYAKIPTSYGITSIFTTIGARMMTAFMGKESWSKAFMGIAGATANAFDPLGNEDSWVAKMFPSFMRPGVHIEENKNWTGKPLYPDNQYNKGLPDSGQHFKNDSAFGVEAAKKMNEWTGGNNYKPGNVDVHPGAIDHMLQAITGGLGRFAKGVITTIWGAYSGDEWEPNKTPILRRFIGAVGNESDNATYYESRNESKDIQNRLARAKKDIARGVNVDEARQFIEENRNQRQQQIFSNADSQLKRFRSDIEQVQGSDNTPEYKRQAIVIIQSKMREIQNQARGRSKALKEETQ